MRTVKLFFTVAILLVTASFVYAQVPAKKAKAAKAVYTCTMHPEVISDKPGKCPKCGMDLVKKEGVAKKPMKAKKPQHGA